jgi:AraC-like DNA-binding protein
MYASLPVVQVTLEDLRANARGTVASRVPVVLYNDLVEGSWSQRLRHANFLSLYLTERGRGIHVIDGIPYGISRGDVYVMAAGSDHAFTQGEKLALRAIHFGRAMFDDPTWTALASVPGLQQLVLNRAKSHRLHLVPDAYAPVASEVGELWTEWWSDTPASAILVHAILLHVLIRLARLASGERPPAPRRPAPDRHREEIVAAAVGTVDQHYSAALRVSQLASSAHLSPDRFSEIFGSIMGRTPRDYIRHVRLEHAKRLLLTSALPVSEVARVTGFRDSPYFARAFRAAIGLSPRAFRQGAKAG